VKNRAKTKRQWQINTSSSKCLVNSKYNIKIIIVIKPIDLKKKFFESNFTEKKKINF
jgi:hypothetical protein